MSVGELCKPHAYKSALLVVLTVEFQASANKEALCFPSSRLGTFSWPPPSQNCYSSKTPRNPSRVIAKLAPCTYLFRSNAVFSKQLNSATCWRERVLQQPEQGPEGVVCVLRWRGKLCSASLPVVPEPMEEKRSHSFPEPAGLSGTSKINYFNKNKPCKLVN